MTENPRKKVKTSEPHDVEIREIVDDVFDDEMLPATQLPVPTTKRGSTRRATGANRTGSSSGSKPASGAKTGAKTSAKTGAKWSARSGAKSAARLAGKFSSNPAKRSNINMTQKRKENISSAFMTSLRNKGISDELMRTKR